MLETSAGVPLFTDTTDGPGGLLLVVLFAGIIFCNIGVDAFKVEAFCRSA